MTALHGNTVDDEKAETSEAESVDRQAQVIDRQGDTFFDRQSNDPKDPLNWTLPLKASFFFFFLSYFQVARREYLLMINRSRCSFRFPC